MKMATVHSAKGEPFYNIHFQPKSIGMAGIKALSLILLQVEF